MGYFGVQLTILFISVNKSLLRWRDTRWGVINSPDSTTQLRLHALHFSYKTWNMNRELPHKLTQREAMSQLAWNNAMLVVKSCTLSNQILLNQTPVSAKQHYLQTFLSTLETDRIFANLFCFFRNSIINRKVP